jgi:hypothetical protein
MRSTVRIAAIGSLLLSSASALSQPLGSIIETADGSCGSGVLTTVGPPFVSLNGVVVYWGDRSCGGGDEQAVYTYDTSRHTVADTVSGGYAPPSGAWQALGGMPSINSNGDVAFWGTYGSGGTNHYGLFLHRAGSSAIDAVAVEGGTFAVDSNTTATINSLTTIDNKAVLSDRDDLVYAAVVSTSCSSGCVPQSSVVAVCYWSYNNGSPTTNLAMYGDSGSSCTPNTPPDGYNSGTFLSQVLALDINAGGQIAVLADTSAHAGCSGAPYRAVWKGVPGSISRVQTSDFGSGGVLDIDKFISGPMIDGTGSIAMFEAKFLSLGPASGTKWYNWYGGTEFADGGDAAPGTSTLYFTRYCGTAGSGTIGFRPPSVTDDGQVLTKRCNATVSSCGAESGLGGVWTYHGTTGTAVALTGDVAVGSGGWGRTGMSTGYFSSFAGPALAIGDIDIADRLAFTSTLSGTQGDYTGTDPGLFAIENTSKYVVAVYGDTVSGYSGYTVKDVVFGEQETLWSRNGYNVQSGYGLLTGCGYLTYRVRIENGSMDSKWLLYRWQLGTECPCPNCTADFDGDGTPGTDADIAAFWACMSGNCCGTCHSTDINCDGAAGTDADIDAFYSVLSGGPCR